MQCDALLMANHAPFVKYRSYSGGELQTLSSITFNFITMFLDSPHVMISYQWKNKAVLLRVRDRLMEEGYKVWMDVHNMSEYNVNSDIIIL